MGTVFKLIYRSRAIWHPDQRENEETIARIVTTARAYNALHGITGLLLVGAQGYAQILEGREGAVDALYRRILIDPRHAQVELLYTDHHADRDFGNWAMAVASASAPFDIELTSTYHRFDVPVPDNAEDIRLMLRALLVPQPGLQRHALH